MSDDQMREDHEKLRKEVDELRRTVINQSGRIAQLDQKLALLSGYVDQLKRGA